MKHAQEVEGWALDEGNRITQTMSLNEATYVTVAKGLQRQHARSVRIIKAEMKRVKLDQYTYRSEERCLILGSLETVLNALQRGRGEGVMVECPHCKGAKGWSFTDHDQSCVFEEVCERHRPEWLECRTCEGRGMCHELTAAIYRARGGPAPIPMQGFA